VGNRNVAVTERGFTFGYRNLVVDFRGFLLMHQAGLPVIFDGTHSVQTPGGRGDASGGDREMIPTLCLAAAAAGMDGLFLEVHPDPDRAPSDGPNMLPLAELESLLRRVVATRAAALGG
jgi:2-dehydro-3-deoxyphosphooctonate aldolase (KDO 8-P synthase)